MIKFRIDFLESDGRWRNTYYSAPDTETITNEFLIEFFGLDECVDYKITRVA